MAINMVFKVVFSKYIRKTAVTPTPGIQLIYSCIPNLVIGNIPTKEVGNVSNWHGIHIIYNATPSTKLKFMGGGTVLFGCFLFVWYSKIPWVPAWDDRFEAKYMSAHNQKKIWTSQLSLYFSHVPASPLMWENGRECTDTKWRGNNFSWPYIGSIIITNQSICGFPFLDQVCSVHKVTVNNV